MYVSSNFRIKVPHHNYVMGLLSQDMINGFVEAACLVILVSCRWCIYFKDLQLVYMSVMRRASSASSATLELPEDTLVMLSCLRGSLHLLVHCCPQSGTAGGLFGKL